MRHSTASVLFRLQKKVEGVLNWTFPHWWVPLYKMVAFTSIPYSEAIDRARAQDAVFQNIGTGLKVGLAALTTYAAVKGFGAHART